MTWRFDAKVAETFVDHARQHIPNYEKVIDKSVALCQHLLTPSSCIIDVGCATGHTLIKLQQAGFKNLVGVDASADMLSFCHSTADLICSSTLPQRQYDAVLCNWTLHFVKDKVSYLKDVYQYLQPGGFLILSEKTSRDELPLNFYHQFKRQQGVSDHDINQKANSVKDIMQINQPAWYIDTLHAIGFDTTYIIDADWCFTSFLSIKHG